MQTVASDFAHITAGRPTGSSVSPGAVGFWSEGSFPRADAQHLAAAATSPALPNTNVAPFHTSRSVKSLASTAQKALGFNRCRCVPTTSGINYTFCNQKQYKQSIPSLILERAHFCVCSAGNSWSPSKGHSGGLRKEVIFQVMSPWRKTHSCLELCLWAQMGSWLSLQHISPQAEVHACSQHFPQTTNARILIKFSLRMLKAAGWLWLSKLTAQEKHLHATHWGELPENTSINRGISSDTSGTCWEAALRPWQKGG